MSIYPTLISIDNYLEKKSDEHIRNQIFKGLTNTPKHISSTFFYDTIGSRLFEEITHLPEYYLTRTEMKLLQKMAPMLTDDLFDSEIIELGSGDCKKISIILDAVPTDYYDNIWYIPFDVSSSAIQQSADILLNRFPNLKIQGVVADFSTQLDVINSEKDKLFCFLGSTIGNFSLQHAEVFLKNISNIMDSDDRLLLGFDMVKDTQILEAAYNDQKKVTEAFNKNILNVINSYIEANFNTNDFDHVAFYNEEKNRIEMHLKARKNVTVTSSYFSDPIKIQMHECIHTENSYKFTTDQIHTLASRANLQIKQHVLDENQWFSLVYLQKET